MSNNSIYEIVVYFHGVSPEVQDRNMTISILFYIMGFLNEYVERILAGVKTFAVLNGGVITNIPSKNLTYKLLTSAQQNLGGQVIHCIEDTKDGTINPVRLVLSSIRRLTI